jgi:hypothetical protein
MFFVVLPSSFLVLICFDKNKFEFLRFFSSLILFWIMVLVLVSFSGQTSGVWFGLWSNQKFWVNLRCSKLGQKLRPCFDSNVFAKGFL